MEENNVSSPRRTTSTCSLNIASGLLKLHPEDDLSPG
jgi:hypothetical protein